jgi:hypothetical protein
MKESYRSRLALPPGISFRAVWEADATVNMAGVRAFVDSLQRPGWYKNENGSNSKDTQLYMLEIRQPFRPEEIRGKLTRTWTCENCRGVVLYEGVQLGHINNWKAELVKAGVKNAEEAKAAYNNLTNLRIECSTCNQSHDWEGSDSESESDSDSE